MAAIAEKEARETQVEQAPDAVTTNLVYDHDEEDPELHARTYLALVAMFLIIYVQVIALQGPPLVLSQIGQTLGNPGAATWVLNALSLVQAVISPAIASASDAFQARKALLVGATIIAVIGAAIAPGSKDIYRLITAQTLIGFGFSSGAIVYSVTSEVVPHRWRPLAQAFLNTGAALGASSGPLIMGAFHRSDPANGWRKFFWVEMALWAAAAVGVLVGYQPIKRTSRFQGYSFLQKIKHLDLPGIGLLMCGLSVFLVGLSLGGGLYTWTNARTLSTLIIGFCVLVAFGVYEWKGTTTGFLHHDLFRGGKSGGRTFTLCAILIFLEGIILFAYVLFFPVLTQTLFELDTFLLAAREQAFWLSTALSTVAWGWLSSKFRTIREPLLAGFLLFTAGMVGFATIQPGHSVSSLVFSVIGGFGFGSPYILIIVGVQLSTPHALIATASAVILSSRAIAATVFTAVYYAIFGNEIAIKLPEYVSSAAISAGVPLASLPAFIDNILSYNVTRLATIPEVSEAAIVNGFGALKHAYADSIRPIFIVASCFGVVGMIVCCFLGDLSQVMNYRVDAPVELLHSKKRSRAPGAEP